MKKINRVRKAQEFQSLIHNGKKTVNMSFVMYSQKKAEDQARIGISLSKKIGNAVERNKIKRQVRMMCQELVDFSDYPFDVILIVRFGYRSAPYEQNKKNLEKLLLKATM
jgi:ribonuclease P protein component